MSLVQLLTGLMILDLVASLVIASRLRHWRGRAEVSEAELRRIQGLLRQGTAAVAGRRQYTPPIDGVTTKVAVPPPTKIDQRSGLHIVRGDSSRGH